MNYLWPLLSDEGFQIFWKRLKYLFISQKKLPVTWVGTYFLQQPYEVNRLWRTLQRPKSSDEMARAAFQHRLLANIF